MKCFPLLLAALCLIPAAGFSDSIESLDLVVEVRRDNTMRVKQSFRLVLEDETIQRGPKITHLGVFRGTAGLVFDNEMTTLAVTRGGEPEPFHSEFSNGSYTLYVGEKDVILDRGTYDYTVEYEVMGAWKAFAGTYYDSLNLSGLLEIPAKTIEATVIFPEGTVPETAVASRIGQNADRSAVEFRTEGNTVYVETSSPMRAGENLTLYASWPTAGFDRTTGSMLILKQYPKIPLALFSGFVLLWILALLVRRLVVAGRAKRIEGAIA